MKIRTALASVALSGGMLIALPGAANASTSDTYEAQVTKYTNIQRLNYNKVTLKTQYCVDRYAEAHARWLASHRQLKHQSMTKILNNCGLRSVGENIARGFSTGPAVVSAWMKSTGHRANILKSGYRWIGVGAYKDSRGVWWVSQVFGTKK